MTRPSFATSIAALRTTDARFPWVGPSDEEADVAAAIEAIEDKHQASADEPDTRGKWGRCRECAEPWPCPTWTYGEEVAVQFLGRAADRAYAHARAAMDGHRESTGAAT